MNKKRIVITGMGVVSCFGDDVETFTQNLLEGKSGISTITQFPCEDFTTKFAGVIHDFNPGEYIDKKQARRVDPFIAYAMVAGKKALEMGKLQNESLAALDKTRCGILIGSGMGGMGVFADGVQTLIEKGAKRVTPFFVPYILTNMAGAILGMDIGFMGPNYSISTACATSNNAIIAAAIHIQNGDADLMLAGGSEAAIIPMGIAGFCACKALSPRNDAPTKASRPWDRDRDGFVMGEGAGVIVMETLEHALARGAPILAEYIGGGVSCDAHHITEPRQDGEGIALCIKNALKHAGITEDQVNYINAHATSTPAGDLAEINAMKKIFSNPGSILVNSTKSMTGHLLGAAGGIEAIATIQALVKQKVHPTINLENPEPNLEFDIPTSARQADIKVAMSNSFGFGGHNACILFKKYEN